MKSDFYKRISRAEAIADAQKAELMETLQTAYEAACADQNEDAAADLARKIRNKLLADSDSRMALDRLGISVPSGSTFTAWLSFLRGLGEVLLGSWASYRQQLRDLTQQPGFPFDIIFPTPPDSEEGSE